MSDTLEATSIVLDTVEFDTNDPTRSHIVNCPEDKESTAAWITEARIFGLPVTGLCGKVWVPEKNPERYPICNVCLAEAEKISKELGING